MCNQYMGRRYYIYTGQVLHEHGFPVPTPIDQARHTILMELIDAYPLYVIDFALRCST
jgi:RIO-like serine/threonine protein kinase